MKMLSVLVAASFERGRGSGHLLRAAALVRALRSAGMEVFLLLRTDRDALDACHIALDDLTPFLITETEAAARHWTLIVTDRFRTPAVEFKFLRSLGPLLGIDEGGRWRSHFDFLFDILPALPSRSKANICDPSLITLPKTRKKQLFPPIPASGAKILVVFGSEDEAKLSLPAACAALRFPKAEVTVISPVITSPSDNERLTIVDAIPNLREEFARFDLVITHFGLSAFESLYAGTPAALIAPSWYHHRLALASGLFSIGTGQRSIKRLSFIAGGSRHDSADTLNEIVLSSRAAAERYELVDTPKTTLAALIGSFSPVSPARCPLCGAKLGIVKERYPDKSYRLCRNCKTYSMSRIFPPAQTYGDSYFFEEYERQYGKTYLEDFPHLKALARQRLQHIKPGGRLLDIGCAYGPFLAAAAEAGFDAQGLDPSEGAVRFIRENLGLRAAQGFFPTDISLDTRAREFDVITLWYVIEHFTQPEEALRKAAILLKHGGTLAFSTPSAAGISVLFSRRRFLKTSPADHWTIWHPRYVRTILKRYGFIVTKIVITGHHPERFPVIGARLGRFPPLYHLFTLISKLFRLGDTFEVYARLAKA